MNNGNAIAKVEVITNCRILNTHNNHQGARKSVMRVEYRSGKCRLIDLTLNVDFTDVDYLEVIYPLWGKKYLLFQENDEELKV